MNKCHFYLSSGLWEVVKCYFEPDTKLHNVYFWGMAVAPHHTCFASHIVCTPWQQSWATIKLLEYCLKRGQSSPQFDIFCPSDLIDVSKEIDFQYTLREYASDPFVQALFVNFAKPSHQNGAMNELDSDIFSNSLQQFLLLVLNNCSSTAHCIFKQIAQSFQKASDAVSVNHDLCMLVLGSIQDPLPYQRLAPLADSSYRSELFLLLLANGHASHIRRIEAEEQQKIVDSKLEHLNQLLDTGIEPPKLFELMLVTDRHFVLYLLDLLELNPVILNPCRIPNFLWPLLLLRLWGRPDLVESQTQFLIDKCKESTTDQVILRVCFMLEWYLNFSRWSDTQGTEKRVGLESARDHSVLHLIHDSADLTHADWAQVRALLHEPWDLQLLNGFCAHILLLRAMTASANLRRERVKLCDSVDLENRIQLEYQSNVTALLCEIQEIIKNLRPLRFRLEVLENLFALLFVTWEDLQSVRLRRHSVTELRSPNSGRPAGSSKGFVCDPHFLRDTVMLIKESTAELERESKTDDEIDVPCSIKPSQMENRLDRLSESLSEATWRLQLVTSPEFVADVGSIAFCHERHSFEPEWLVDSWQDQGKSKRRSCQEKREESGSQSPASGGETDKNAERPPGPGFMHQMLASDWSLVVRCLSQNDLLNAEHIITMMSTEESRQVLEGELNFTQAVNDVRRKLEIQGEFSSRKGSEIINKSPRKTAGLQAVQQVAAEAVSATALANHIERFLSTTTLPIFQGSSKIVSGSMPQCMDNSAAIVTLDLAIASSSSYQDFRDLYNLAGRHCPELTSRLQAPLGGTPSPKPFGYIAFSQTLMALLIELNKEKSMTPNCFFRTRLIPFSLKTLKEQDNLWKQIRMFEQDLRKSKRESDLLNKDIAKGQKNIKCMQKMLENVAKITENAFEMLESGRSESGNNDTKIVNYCELLNRYLSDLATLSLDFITTKSDGDNAVTFHTLLEQSAVEVLDRLVFQYHIDPALLEKKAQQLGFNLCASLLWGCCPSIPQGPALPHSQEEPLPDCLILNLFQKPYSAETQEDPAKLVSKILSELLDALRKLLNMNNDDDDVTSCLNFVSLAKLSALRKDATIASVLQRTQLLQTISMTNMQPENNFAFLTNICNLLILHCLLDDSDNSVKNGLCSPRLLIRETVVWYVGYQIGEVGFLSLGELRSALCGEEFSQPFSLRSRSPLLKSISPDPRTLFVIPTLQLLNPGPRLLLVSEDNSEVQLTKAIETYTKNHIRIEENQLHISSFLGWYLDYVLLRKEAEGSCDGGSLRPRRIEALLDFLTEHTVHAEWRTELKSITGAEIVINQKQLEAGIFLEYCDHIHSADPQLRELKSAERWTKRNLTEPIIKQLSQNSRLLADLVVRLHEDQNDGDSRGLEMGKDVLLDERMRCFESLLVAPWVQTLAVVYNNNPTLAALNKTPSVAALWNYLTTCIEENQWPQCWSIIQAIPDFTLLNYSNLHRIRDLILYEMAAISKSDSGWIFAQLISDINIRIGCVMVNYCHWPGDIALKQLNSILRDVQNLPPLVFQEIECNINMIRIFIKIVESCPDFENKSWFDIASLTAVQPKTILESLLNYNKFEICVDWLHLPGVIQSIIPHIDAELMIQFAGNLPGQLQELFSSFPSADFLLLCEDVIPKLTSLVSLRNVSELCVEISREESDKSRFRKILLGIDLLSVLDDIDQVQLAHLVSEPLLAIEQLVMNTRLDSLTVLLKKLRQLSDGVISEKEVYDLLAKYASKAVELKLISVVNASVKESFLISPIAPPKFEVPTAVPDKSQWIPDNQVSVCLCCQLVTFSMFNRRHHCRRCGRVICASCSPHRIKVESYEDVAVRVCQTCYTQHSKPEGDVSVDTVDESSINEDTHYWSLTPDSVKNEGIREEFAFEHAPNSSLCLAIFNLLPNSPTYTSLLLDESEKLLELLQGRDTAANPEVDYTVLINIIRSLVIGAKVRYGQTGLTTGVVSCDRLLSQVDVVSLLVKNQCTRLIPPEPLGGDTLRALRDRLVEEELWDLAIELSTKAGLSLAGVWAAWGKILLATGCWQEARQKFSQCLLPTASNLRNSPLLDEICHIIETTSFSTFQLGSSAQEVLELLSSLKGLATGKAPVQGPNGPGSVQYAEQEWYLTRYGNSAGLLKFYLRHENYRSALDLMLQRQLDPEIFVESIILPTYQISGQECLKQAMFAIDPSLESLKRYLIAACLLLQKNQFLHYLRDIQLFMKDYVRAAMTCIQLFQGHGKNFSCQQEVIHLLHSCLSHLEEELSATNKCVQRLDHVMRLDHREINRHKNTVSRQLEVTKFLAGCEVAGQSTSMLLTELSWTEKNIPTLFHGQKSKNILAATCVLAGKNVEEGFGLSFRIIQECGLDQEQVYMSVGKVLAAQERSMDLPQLAQCIKTSGSEVCSIVCDKTLVAALSAMNIDDQLSHSKILISLIANTDQKILALIHSRQLKEAYLIAVSHKKLELVQTIMEEAEKTGQHVIRNICRKKLGLLSESISTTSSVPSRESL